MAISHVKSNAAADFTGTVTVLNSQGSTTTALATDLIRPGDWNSVHNQFLTLSGNTLGGSTLSGTNIVLAGGNNVTLSKVNDTRFDIVGPNTVAQTVQTQNMVAASLSGNSTSAGAGYILMSSGTMILAGGNNVTLSQNGMSVTISAFNQTVQTQTHNVTLGGNSTSAGAGYIQISTGTMLLAGGNNVTLSQNGASVTISAFNQTVQTQTHNVTLGGNSTSAGAGYIQISTGTMLLAGGNNITLSQNGASVTISAANAPAQTNQTLGIYASSQTVGQSSFSTHDARSLTVVGQGAISVGWSAGSFLISANAGGGAGAAISIGGNSTSAGAGYSNITSGTAVLMGGPNITLSQNGASISISAAAAGAGPTREGYVPFADHLFVAGQQGQGTLVMDPDVFPNFSCDRIALLVNYTATSNQSGTMTASFWVGIYTRNASTLSLLSSQSSSYAVTNSGTVGSYSLVSGMRLLTMPFSTSFSEGRYWIAVLSRTTTGGAAGMSMSQMLLSQANTNFVGYWQSSNNTTMQVFPGQGVYTATTNAMPNSIGFNQLRGSDSMAFRFPIMKFLSSTY